MPYEILVHISAPTTKERDDLYRDEALAYKNFKPSTKLYLDERDGKLAAHVYRHPRHHALQEDEAWETQRSPLRTFGLESFSVTEPDSSNQFFRQFETQVILDTQQAIGALDSQISTNTNSFYDGTTLSLTEHRPAKRRRTAEPISESFSSGRGGLPAPTSPSSYRSPYALNTSFSGFDPISSLLPESYGLSKSGGSNSAQRAEEVTNGIEFSPFPTTPQRLRDDFSRAYYTPEDDAAALLLSLRTGGSSAISNNSTIVPASRNNSPTARKSRALFRDRLSVPARQGSNLSRQQTPDASQPVEINSADGENLSPKPYHAPINSPGHRLLLKDARSVSKRADGGQATDNDPLPSTSHQSPVKDTQLNGFTRSQLDPGSNGLYATKACGRLDSHGMEGHGPAGDESSSRRSSISVGQKKKNGNKTTLTVVGRTSARSPVEGDDLPSRTNSSQTSVSRDVIPETRENQMTDNRQPDKIALSPRISRKPREVTATEPYEKPEETLNDSVTTPAPTIAIVSPPSTPPVRTLDKKTEKLLQEINALPLEVFSPKAPVGLDGPVTFVTPIIAAFYGKAELRKRWARNATISRPISSFEIGHWVIDTKSWSPRLQLSFWRVLTNQIGLRQAGVSTWCKRIPEPGQLGTVKVYCWGELVKHLFLFLFTIADTGISSQEACWLDGQDQVVVRVRQRQASR